MTDVKLLKSKNKYEPEKKRKVSDEEVQEVKKQAGKFLTAEELEEKSGIDFDDVEDPKEMLQVMLQTLLSTIPIAHGLYRAKPSQGNSYALSNLVSNAQNIIDQIQSQTDYEDLAEKCIDNVIAPALESIILELGRSIRSEIKDLKTEVNASNKDLERIQESFNSIYRKFGQLTTEKIKKLRTDMVEYMTE